MVVEVRFCRRNLQPVYFINGMNICYKLIVQPVPYVRKVDSKEKQARVERTNRGKRGLFSPAQFRQRWQALLCVFLHVKRFYT